MYIVVYISQSQSPSSPGENRNSKRSVQASIYCSTIYNSQDMEASAEEWKKEVRHIYTMEYYPDFKKEWYCAICIGKVWWIANRIILKATMM